LSNQKFVKNIKISGNIYSFPLQGICPFEGQMSHFVEYLTLCTHFT